MKLLACLLTCATAAAAALALPGLGGLEDLAEPAPLNQPSVAARPTSRPAVAKPAPAPAAAKPTPMLAMPLPVLPEGPRPFKIFDGKPKVIAMLTSSHRGDRELFPRIRKMPGSENITLRTRGYCTDEDGRRVFPSTLPARPDEMPDYCPRQKLAGDEPVILIVLSGALRARGFPPVPGSCTDRQAVDRGVTIMREGVQRAEAQGVSWVLLSTMHYNPNVAWPHCVGWERAGDLVAAYNQTEIRRRHPAVDVFTPLRPYYPLYFSQDMYHCNGFGRELVAHLWFAALCAWDGLKVPAWSWQMVEAAAGRELNDRLAIREIRVREVAWPQADSRRAVEVTWTADAAQGDFAAEYFRCEQYYAARGGASGSGRFYPMPAAQVRQEQGRWRLLWPLPASKQADAQGSFRSGDHYFIKVVSRKTNQWNVSAPVKLGPGGDPAPWTRRP